MYNVLFDNCVDDARSLSHDIPQYLDLKSEQLENWSERKRERRKERERERERERETTSEAKWGKRRNVFLTVLPPGLFLLPLTSFYLLKQS
jgi:hypothetical protein